MLAAIHAGAGHYRNSDIPEKLCGAALRKHEGRIVEALMDLEEEAVVNCGLGSNLNRRGKVECEAAYMSSILTAFGAVGAVSNCMHPVYAARSLASEYRRKGDKRWMTIPPILLVGTGADEYCSSLGVGLVETNSALHTPKAMRQFQWATSLLETAGSVDLTDAPLDTAGGVSIKPDGEVEACVSSGGIALKHEGRLGHSTQFGAAIWAERRRARSVAITLSGCGEALMRTRIAERLGTTLLEKEDEKHSPYQLVSEVLLSEFLLSRHLRCFPLERVQIGGLVLYRDGTHNELIIFHNTPHLPYALYNKKSVAIQKISTYSAETRLANFLCESILL